MSNSRDLALARYYDTEYRDYKRDLEFYVQYALAMHPKRKGPVLELGCGTGRITLALAEAGFSVVGVDSSLGMLQVLEEKLKASGLSKRVKSVKGDMRDLSELPHVAYPLAFCALNTFTYLTSSSDQIAMLASVRSKLSTNGLLIIDLTPPLPSLLPPGDGEIIHQGSYSYNGAQLHKMVTGVSDPATQTHSITIFYDLEQEDGTLRRISQNLEMRWTGRYEMELLLKHSGYTLEQIYGNYELDLYHGESERMIFVARA